MYSHYMNGIFAPLMQPHPQDPPRQKASPAQSSKTEHLKSGLTGILNGLTKQFSLQNLDTGDILLVLIILFLFLEGDNLDLVITLGLLLLLGLNNDQDGS